MWANAETEREKKDLELGEAGSRGRGKVGVTAAGKKKTVSTSVGQNSTFVE